MLVYIHHPIVPASSPKYKSNHKLTNIIKNENLNLFNFKPDHQGLSLDLNKFSISFIFNSDHQGLSLDQKEHFCSHPPTYQVSNDLKRRFTTQPFQKTQD